MASRNEICAKVDAIIAGCRDLQSEVERYRQILAACEQLEHEGWDSKAITVVREGGNTSLVSVVPTPLPRH
jgi:hypothetical protein